MALTHIYAPEAGKLRQALANLDLEVRFAGDLAIKGTEQDLEELIVTAAEFGVSPRTQWVLGRQTRVGDGEIVFADIRLAAA